ncbi:MAG: CHAT domain-containing protein [Acetobacteraceae bacterium]
MTDGRRISRLLQALRDAFAARDSRRAREAINALLPLTLGETDQHSISAGLETLAYACQLSLVVGDPDAGERYLGAFKRRLSAIGDRALSDGHRQMLAMFEADIAALRANGVARGDCAGIFFATASQLLGVAAGKSRAPDAAESLLRQVTRLPAGQAREGLTCLVSLTDRIVENRFRAGNRGEVLAWLDAVEPFIPLCDPQEAVRFAVGWSSMYRNTALHGESERLADEVAARFEDMIDAIPPPPDADPTDWATHKGSMIESDRLFGALDRAMVLGIKGEIAPAARAILSSVLAEQLPSEERQRLEQLAACEPPQPDSSVRLLPGDLGYNMSLLMQALAQLHAGQPSKAGDLLAALLAAGAERDADLAWNVPLLLAHCLLAVASDRPGLLPAATSLLKEAVRQLERQKLEVAEYAPGALQPTAVGPAADAYTMLVDMLLAQDRISEAVRVEILRVERACRLPSAADQTLRDIAAERLPAFPAERDHWSECHRSAALLRPGDGGCWLAQIVARPPQLHFAQEGGLGGQRPAEGELYLGFVAAKDEILTVARSWRCEERRLRHRIAATTFNKALLRLQMAIRQEDEQFMAPAEALGAMLFGPLLDLLQQEAPRRLLIEPAGVIMNVPFSALRVGGAWLAEQYEIVLPNGWQTSANDDARSDSLVSICVPHSGREAALRWVEKDVEEINTFAEATGMQLRTVPGAAARRGTVLDLLARPPRLLHLSCHFKPDIVDMANSAFLLADGERLTVEALSRCPLRGVDLALLLGCETASRQPAAPDSAIVGVDAALLRLGVRSVVSSQWPVDDHASHLFLAALLAALREPGMSKAAAVRQAQMAVLNCGFAPFRHPAHWAAFVLSGQG